MPGLDQEEPQRLDEGALAHPGNAGEASDPVGGEHRRGFVPGVHHPDGLVGLGPEHARRSLDHPGLGVAHPGTVARELEGVSRQARAEKIVRLPGDRVALPVIEATEAERAEHEAQLDAGEALPVHPHRVLRVRRVRGPAEELRVERPRCLRVCRQQLAPAEGTMGLERIDHGSALQSAMGTFSTWYSFSMTMKF